MGMGNYRISSLPLYLGATRPHSDGHMTNVTCAKYVTFYAMCLHLLQLGTFQLDAGTRVIYEK